MKIALLGYGKMGKSIEKIALQRNHSIVLKTSSKDYGFKLKDVDVAIDFSTPTSAFNNISICINHKVPVISGTTGWLEDYSKIVELCKSKNGTFLYASNFSLGVNLFFELNRSLSKLMTNFPEYHISMEEIHHTQKLDAPSGTAISLANDIIKHSEYTNWTLDNTKANELKIIAKRIENVPGTHEVTYASQIDSIQITHTAHSREGFALGAVIAAEWIADKKGIFTMNDVLKINTQ